MTLMIPPTIHSSVSSGAEHRMFRVIGDATGTNEWVCLHSLGLARHDRKRRGEIDFVLLTEHGVFTLEVKGGRIRREDGVWIGTDKYGVSHRKPESPFQQAAEGMFALEKDIQREFKGSRIGKVLFGYGVVLPDVEFPSLGCEDDPALVYDRRCRNQPFRTFIDRLAQFARQRDRRPRLGLGKSEIRELAEFLRRDFDLIPSLDVVLDDTGQELARLTKEQRIVLDTAESQERILVQGAAGTGKTVLAIETARRAARRGGNVLVLCYNKLLRRGIDAVVGAENYRGNIRVRTLHKQFRSMVEASSLSDEFDEVSLKYTHQERFDVLYPEYAALASLEGVESPYDCLVLDEAQDILNEKNTDVLNELLKGGLDNGRWRIFLDSNNQASVYGRLQHRTLDRLRRHSVQPMLTVNCRNTKQIELNTSILSNPELRARAITEGPRVEFITYGPDESPFRYLQEILSDLKKDNVVPGRISILFPRVPAEGQERELLKKLDVQKLRETDVASLGTDELKFVTWSAVSGFKGLENDVVILAGVENIEKDWWRAVTYVGMSRAKIQLYVIFNTECESAKNIRFEQEMEFRIGPETMYV